MAGDLAHYELHHEDETHLDTNPYLRSVWHRPGQQALLPAAGTNRRLTDFGSVEVFGRGRVDVLCAEQGSAGFAHYLEALDERHAATGREVFLVLDHASCHDSEQSQAALAVRARWLHVIPLARYSPHLNRKEREGRYLKRGARSHLPRSLREFADEVLAGLRRLGGERLDIIDRVPNWFLQGHCRPIRPHLGRPKGAKDLRGLVRAGIYLLLLRTSASPTSASSGGESARSARVWERNRNRMCYTNGMMTALLEHTLLEAHDPASGRYDALRVGQSLGLSATEMAQVLGCTPRGLRKNPDSPRLQERLTRLMATVTLLRELLDGSMPYVRVWLRAPHPAFGGRTPLSYLLAGQLEPVEDLVRAVASGQPD